MASRQGLKLYQHEECCWREEVASEMASRQGLKQRDLQGDRA